MIYLILLSLAVIAATCLLFFAVSSLQSEIPKDDDTYRDSPPPLLRKVWPVVRFVRFHLGAKSSIRSLERAHEMIARAGMNYILNAEELMAIRILAAVVLGGLMLFGTFNLGPSTYLPICLFGVALGYVYPGMWLNKRYSKRRDEILKTLPTFLDYIVLGVEAGMNFSGALGQTVEKGPEGPLRQEFFIVLRDIRAGLSRTDALKRMDERLKVPEVGAFISAIVQAESVGASIGNVLRLQAERRRTERFQRAEKLAMEAPVKLILPLVMFIFPTTFIVLGFPIAMLLMHQG